ncbi:embigin [Discoglossus pictus]
MRTCVGLPVLLPLSVLLAVATSGITDTEPGPEKAASAEQKDTENISNHTVIQRKIFLTDLTPKKEKIIIEKPSKLDLFCELPVRSNILITDVFWKHGDKLINSNQYTYNNTFEKWQTLYQLDVTDQSKFETYTCMFNENADERGEFHVEGPHIKSGDKPLVSYNKDSVTMKCDSSEYKPIEWIWYKMNGSEKVQLNFSVMPNKYDLHNEKANETKLIISDLTESDSGIYLCKAIFKIGEFEGRYELNVLSVMVPLKVFFAIAAEVAVLVAIILLYELYSKNKHKSESDVKTDFEPIENLKSEDSSSQEANTIRQRNV